MSRQLPPNPHLDSLKKQAKQLLKGYQSGQTDAAERVDAVLAELPAAAASFTLRDAQQVVAREYGFTSWQNMLESVGVPAAAEKPRYMNHCETMAQDLLEALGAGHDRAAGHGQEVWRRVRQVLPRYADASRQEIEQEQLSLAEARTVVASEVGFDSWDALERRVREYWPAEPPINLDQLRGLERLHDEFVQRLALTLTSSPGMEQRVDADTAFADQTSYGEFVNSISNATPVYSYRLSIEGMADDVVLDLARPVVAGLLSVGDSGLDEGERLDYFVERIARDLEKTWEPLAEITVRSWERYRNVYAIEAAEMYEIVELIAFEANGKGADSAFSGLVSLCYPVSAIQELVPALGEYWLQEAAA